MLPTIAKIFGAAALLVAATACSSGTQTPTAPVTSAPVAAAPSTAAAPDAAADPAADRAAVEKTFTDYNAALVARDFATACSLTAPGASDALVQAVNAQGAQVTSCEEAFKAVFAVPEASAPLDEAAKSSKIDDVSVDGDIATVTYSGSAGGQTKTNLSNKMQRIDGQWRLLGNDA